MSGVDFDYDFAQKNFHATNPGLRVKFTNPQIAEVGDGLGVVIGGYSLNDSSTYVSSNTAATVDSSGVLTITAEKLKPATVYRMRLHFFKKGDSAQSPARYIGSTSRVYQFTTDGVSDIDKARARIVMRALSEANDWELGKVDYSKGYTNDPGYGWCHVFYNWNIKPFIKTQSGNNHTHYNPGVWQQAGGYMSGADLGAVAKNESIGGNFFRVGSHVGMILAFDAAKNEYTTLRGILIIAS